MPEDADADKGLISTTSPIGRAPDNKESGDTVRSRPRAASANSKSSSSSPSTTNTGEWAGRSPPRSARPNPTHHNFEPPSSFPAPAPPAPITRACCARCTKPASRSTSSPAAAWAWSARCLPPSTAGSGCGTKRLLAGRAASVLYGWRPCRGYRLGARRLAGGRRVRSRRSRSGCGVSVRSCCGWSASAAPPAGCSVSRFATPRLRRRCCRRGAAARVAGARAAGGVPVDAWIAEPRTSVAGRLLVARVGAPMSSSRRDRPLLAGDVGSRARRHAAEAADADRARSALRRAARGEHRPAGFPRAALAVHDIDAHRDWCSPWWSTSPRSGAARPASGGRRRPRCSTWPASAAIIWPTPWRQRCVPLVTERTRYFAADAYWRGETHRLCDRPAA